MRLAAPLATLPALLLCALAGAAAPAAAFADAEEVKPAFATSGWVKPAEKVRGCVARGVVAPPELKARLTVTVKLAVDPEGRFDRFEDVSTPAAPPEVAAAVRQALGACVLVPGRDPDGQPAYLWWMLDVPVGPPGKAAKGAARAAAPAASAATDLTAAPVDVSAGATAPPQPKPQPKAKKKPAPKKQPAPQRQPGR